MNHGSTCRLASGATLSYREIGDRTAETFLFLPGLGSSSASLPLAVIPDDVRVIAVDRPGYATSSARSYRATEFADDLAEFCSLLGLPPLHLVGHSAGGLHAEVFARRFPRRVRSLSRVSSAPPFRSLSGDAPLSTHWARIRRSVLSRPRATRAAFAAQSLLALAPQHALDVGLRDAALADREVARQDGVRPGLVRSVREGWARSGRGVFDDAVALMQPIDVRPRDPDHPVLLWHGDADTVFPADVLSLNQALYTRPEVHLLPGLGHLAYLSCWHEITAAALATVSQTNAPHQADDRGRPRRIQPEG